MADYPEKGIRPLPSAPHFHLFVRQIREKELPERFTYPFCYIPHPLCREAAATVQSYLSEQTALQDELQAGKMFGVLVVRHPEAGIGFLAAYSGLLEGRNDHPYFVPPIYDMLHPEGYFKQEEAGISELNTRIRQLERAPALLLSEKELESAVRQARQEIESARERLKTAKAERDRLRRLLPSRQAGTAPDPEEELIRESRFQRAEFRRLKMKWEEKLEHLRRRSGEAGQQIEFLKSERKRRSAALQQWIFSRFRISNARGQSRDLCEIFAETVQKTPPAGAGECAAPKLLQYAYSNRLQPIAMAEFWWGNSPGTEIRLHGHYYPACRGKCGPILGFMLQGLAVEDDPQKKDRPTSSSPEAGNPFRPEIVYEDPWIVILNKPAGMLSVPGKSPGRLSAQEWLHRRYPEADGPLLVHRLDMDTSGLLLAAKSKEMHRRLQIQFESRTVRKEYTAWIEGSVGEEAGIIRLPLCPDPLDRPRQIVSEEYGKPAVTRFRVLERSGNRTRIRLEPLTGRTHQLRVHAAHPQGLNAPIKGDPLYGTPADRLYLHAEALEFTHPATGKKIRIEKQEEF